MSHTFSYWEQTSFLTGFDIIIIGSGIVGLTAALHIHKKKPNTRICILENGFLPAGASTKNAGFACFGSISEVIDELESTSVNDFLELVEMRWKGLERLRRNLGDDAIQFQQWGGNEVFQSNEEDFSEQCISAIPYFNKLLSEIIGTHDIYSVNNAKISAFGFAGISTLIENKQEGQINTGSMMKALIRKVQDSGVTIFNNCRVISIENESNVIKVVCEELSFTVRKVILASNAFSSQLLPELDVIPGRGQVLVTEPIANLKLKGTFHYNRGYTYFRNIDNRVLLGGGRDQEFESEKTYEQGNTDGIQNYLENILQQNILPGRTVKIEYRWSGIMGFGNELKPIVKEVRPNLYCAVRCSGMGVAMGSLLGEEVAELATM